MNNLTEYSYKPNIIRRLYHWLLDLAKKPYAIPIAALISFIESSFFPIPPDVIMIPMIIANPKRAWLIALIITVSSVMGGLFGYWIGSGLYDTLGHKIVAFYGAMEHFEEFQIFYEEYGAWAVFTAGITPFPYKIITITSGILHLDLYTFIFASLAARGIRFFAIAALLWYFGDRIKIFIDKYLGIISILIVLIAISGFILLKFI